MDRRLRIELATAKADLVAARQALPPPAAEQAGDSDDAESLRRQLFDAGYAFC